MTTSSILLVEDHKVFATALLRVLSTNKDLTVVAVADTAEKALEQLPDLKVDLVLADISLPHMSGIVDWGSWRFQRPMVGAFGIIDETAETHASEASVHGICLAPSIETLEWLLKRVGFARVERLVPPPDGYEQLVAQKRVMFAAYAG